MHLPVLDGDLLGKLAILGGGGTLGARWLAHVWRRFGKVENLQDAESRFRDQVTAQLEKCNEARAAQEARHEAHVAQVRAEYEAMLRARDERIENLQGGLREAELASIDADRRRSMAEAELSNARADLARAVGWKAPE